MKLNKMNIEFSDIELRALVRALAYIRFESKEYEARYLAGSPFIGEIHKRVSDATAEYYKSKNMPFPDEWPAIESINGYLDVIKIRIKDTDNWKELEPEHRDSFLKTLVYPYKISGDTFAELIRFGDETHSVKS
jgi:hypothetical protein